MGRTPAHDPLLPSDESPPKRGWILFTFLLFLALLVAAAISFIPGHASLYDSFYKLGLSSHEENAIVHSQRAVVASDDRRCSDIGVSMLKKGGHAVDAAIATTLCLGVVCQTSSGIGGGDFIVVHSAKDRKTVALDARETAPAAAYEKMYADNPEGKHIGPMSMAVPGEIAGMYTAWLRYGRLPWRTLFEPSIKLARYGFELSAFGGFSMITHKPLILRDPGMRQVFAPNGTVLRTGDVCYNKELANSLEAIATQGPEAFYGGIVGQNLVNDVLNGGGIMTLDDLKDFKVREREIVTVNSMGYTVHGMPPPSSGTVALAMILNIFESYKSKNPAEGPLGQHRFIEAMKHMFAIRPGLGDPDFVDITETVSKMLSPSYAAMIRDRILDNTTFPPEYYQPEWSQAREHGTSHLSVVDEERNVVALTATVNHGLGSGTLSPSTGIILNNQMDDFSTPGEVFPDRPPPSPANFIRPGKRPLSSMTPMIVFKDDQLVGVLGGSGGLTIAPGIIQVFINHFLLGMKPLEAVNTPRVYHRLIPNIVWYEDWTVFNGDHVELSEERKEFLKERGHVLEGQAAGSICNSVFHDVSNFDRKGSTARGMLMAVSDLRKGGFPAGI